MKKTTHLAFLMLGLAGLSFGSVIDSFSVSAFETEPVAVAYVGEEATEASMAGALELTAHFDDGVGGDIEFSCVWANVSQPGYNCLSAGNFGVSFTNLVDAESLNTHPALSDGFWTITNLRDTDLVTNDIMSIKFDGLFNLADYGSGVAFDRCYVGGVFDDDPTGFCSPSTEGTIGSGEGYTVNDGPGGTAPTEADAEYRRPLYVAGNPVFGDAYGLMEVYFEGNLGFGETFTFLADTDLVTPVPEPATLGLMGVGLLALGLMRRRRR